MEIEIASGLAKIIDEPIRIWGSIREALSECQEDLETEAIEIYQDSDFEVLFGCYLNYSDVTAVNLNPDFIDSVKTVSRATGLRKDQAATFMIDLVRSWIKTSENLGYDY